ncbi:MULTISPECIES: hypothetical protein [Halomonas]|uniref:Uncharacterized protein n=1 Tax=Halomonas halophila TaxID=29573 RepID=A0ABQ0U327_9GAMM|nr:MULTISPECIES: hypothetical protein [Halomonas]MDR5890290.1 hypothetical protein [Halomonas salina]WJY05792.1 hypothetical protein QWG60_08660 [Halomonas halophila]GEK72946.1 hypothetical protein HHA04nite_14900 [Halomonas halophila]
MNIEELEQLTAAQDEAQRIAAESARDAHDKALKAAYKLRDELADTIDQVSEREALKGVVEAAAKAEFNSKPQKEMASIVIGQFAAAVADMPFPATVSRNGSELVARAASAAQGYSADQKRQVFAALVMACLDSSVKTGLLAFPSDWASLPSADGMRQMATALDADAVAKLDAEHQTRAEELATAQRYVDSLEQARPALWVVDADAEPSTMIRNSRGGASTIAGIRFEPGENVLSAEDYATVRNNRSFLAHIESGTLSIESTASLVQEA